MVHLQQNPGWMHHGLASSLSLRSSSSEIPQSFLSPTAGTCSPASENSWGRVWLYGTSDLLWFLQSSSFRHKCLQILTAKLLLLFIQNDANHYSLSFNLAISWSLGLSKCTNALKIIRHSFNFKVVVFWHVLFFSKGILELTGTCSKNLLHHLLAEILLSWIYIVLKGHWLFKS